MRKNGDGVEYQYGEWLKSPGGRTRSPPRRNTTHMNGSDDGVGQNTTVVENISWWLQYTIIYGSVRMMVSP